MRKVALQEVEGMKLFQDCPYGLQLYGTTFDYVTEDEGGQPQFRYQLFMEVADKGTLRDELVSRKRMGAGLWVVGGAGIWVGSPQSRTTTCG